MVHDHQKREFQQSKGRRMNIEKVYSKQQRYDRNMAEKNFVRKKYWVHVDDVVRLKKYADKLRAAHEK